MKFLWLCACLVYPSLGAQLIEREQIELSATNALIHWNTDVPTGTRGQVTPSSATVTVSGDKTPSTNHTITVSGLRAGARYEVRIGTSHAWLATNQFTVSSASAAPNSISASSQQPAFAKAPPSRKTWGNPASLQDHFNRHGADFHAKDPEDYARLAWEFQQQARVEGWPAKIDGEGVLRIFNPKTHAFAAYNRDGTTKTFFKPQNSSYFDRQPGRMVDLKRPRQP